MKKISVLKRFAVSFVDVIYEKKERKNILEHFKLFLSAFDESEELRKVLTNPVLPFSVKSGIVEKIVKEYSLNEEFGNFLKILVKNYAIKYLNDIYNLTVEELNRRDGIKFVELRIAPPFSKKHTRKIEDLLEKKTGLDIVLDVKEEEDLIAGFWLKVGSKIYDGSLKGQLENLKKRLIS